MTFDETLEGFKKFRITYLPILMSTLPTDPAKVHLERQTIEPIFFEAMEWAADLEAFYQIKAAREYEKPECKSWDYAHAMAADEKRWAKKAQAAVSAIESRSIKLSQSIKIMEGR